MHRLARSLALSTCVLLGCAHGPAAQVASPHAGSGVLRAGAAKLDITPLAGLPLGAHSIEGGTGLARWTRLWARAIYLEDAEGQPLVLVACDLWSIPAGLGDAVIDRLHAQHGLTHLDRRHVLLAATHTHHGPAAFASNRLYNRAAGPAMGFDPALHEFLARRIADAIADAALSAEPATLRLERRHVGALARNRSLAPFLANPEADALLAANAELPACSGEPKACKAIDPTLTTLRIDDPQGRAIAVAAFFAVHATAMANATDAYNGDLSTIATFTAERHAGVEGREVVVALFNGAEGDVSPDWSSQGRASTVALGERLGAAIVATAGLGSDCASGQPITGTIANRYAAIPLADQAVDGPEHARTAKRALPGKAILGGAEDGRTRYHRRWPEGQTVARSRRAGQGPKRPAVPPALFSIGFPTWTLVAEVPVSLHRVGPLALAGLPGEFTTVMGMRIRASLREAAGAEPIIPIVVGLADEYGGYFVTPQEYALQHYEGASTSWGQYAGPLLRDAITELVTRDPGPPPRARFDPGQRRDFALRPSDRRALRSIAERLAAQLELAAEPPAIEFDSAPPSWTGPTWPSVAIELRDPEGAWRPFTDDRGFEFVVFPLALERERWRWRAWWLGELPAASQARFRVFGPDGRERCSAAFGPGERPSPLAVDCTAHPEREVIAEEPPGLLVR